MVKHLLGIVLFCSSALGETDWGGKLWGNHLVDSNRPEELGQQNAGGIIEVKETKERLVLDFEGLSYFVKTPFLLTPDRDLDRGEVFYELNDLSLSYTRKDWRLKLGQQTTAWGKSDGINPTDFLSGKRNLVFTPEDQIKRRGHGSAMLEWIPNEGDSPWGLEFWAVPRHSESDVLLNQKITQDLVDIKSSERSKKTELAAKLSYSGSGWEMDGIVFSGVSKTPLYREIGRQLMPLEITLRPVFYEQKGYGTNLAVDLSDWVLRFEGAYIRRDRGLKDVDHLNDPSRFEAVLGMERSFFETHRMNFQLVSQYYPDYHPMVSPDPFTSRIQGVNKIIQGQHTRTRIGYLWVYLFEPTDYNQFKFKLSWLNYFHQESGNLVSPEVNYSLTDNFHLQLYSLIFYGSERSPLGLLRDLSSAGVGGTYQF